MPKIELNRKFFLSLFFFSLYDYDLVDLFLKHLIWLNEWNKRKFKQRAMLWIDENGNKCHWLISSSKWYIITSMNICKVWVGKKEKWNVSCVSSKNTYQLIEYSVKGCEYRVKKGNEKKIQHTNENLQQMRENSFYLVFLCVASEVLLFRYSVTIMMCWCIVTLCQTNICL